MKKSYTCKIGGQAGFGIVTSGLIFSKTARRCGYYLFDYFEYPSLIRGGHNVTETHFGVDPVFSQEEKVDVLVALNRETFDFHKTEIKNGGGIVFDSDQFVITAKELPVGAQLFPVPLTKIIQEASGSKVMENNVALGAAAGLFNFDKETLMGVIHDSFAGKKEDIIIINQRLAASGYEYVKSRRYALKTMSPRAVPPLTPDTFAVLTGNEAVAFGAIDGHCKFYAAYPMTPSTTVLHMLAQYALKTGMVVRHAEDEIAVVNEAIGASFGGVRSMVGTSGGGFALMVESISFAGIVERGLVIFLAQRPGPATGMPTWTEQGDLLFAVNAGHGEFPKIVLAAGDVEEAFRLTFKAHNLADRYQTPVIILSDKYLGESHQDVDKNKLLFHNMLKVDFGKWETSVASNQPPISFPRYQLTDDGISSRVRPGTAGYFYQENSYEHLDDGHTTEDAGERKKQVDKRQRKMTTYLSNDFEEPQLYGDPNAGLTLVGWGSVKNPILETIVNRSDELNKSVNYLHFTHLWPMNDRKVSESLANYKNIALVENNSHAQLGQLLRMVTGCDIAKRLLKYDGRPFYPSEIAAFINNL